MVLLHYIVTIYEYTSKTTIFKEDNSKFLKFGCFAGTLFCVNICLFTESEISQPLPKRDERTEHIVKVLHKKAGDSFDAGIIGGASGTATIVRIGEKGAADEGALHFEFTPSGDGKPLYPLTMIIGFPRPIQLRRLLRDVAGLGVCAVHLTGTELGDKSYMKSTLVEKGAAYQMLLDGTAQAASTHVPELFMHATLRECLEAVREDGAVGIALDNIRPAMSLHAFLYGGDSAAGAGETVVADGQPTVRGQATTCAAGEQSVACGQPTACGRKKIVAAIGSERGWTDRERALLEEFGFVRCGMGARVLRTETAATVAGAIILDALGKLGAA